MCSRPRRSPAMTPDAARTLRCLVTPWRVVRKFAASAEIDAGPAVVRWRRMASRVGSPSAANNRAAAASCFSVRAFRMLLDPVDHLRPALAVVGEHLSAACERDLVEAGFADGEPRARRRGLEGIGDGRFRLLRVVDGGIDFAGMPAPDHAPRRRELHDPDAEALAGVALVGGRHPHLFTRLEVAFDGDAEPGRDLL